MVVYKNKHSSRCTLTRETFCVSGANSQCHYYSLPPSMGDNVGLHLEDTAAWYRSQALAPSTEKAYSTGWKTYLNFCVMSNVVGHEDRPPVPSESFMGKLCFILCSTFKRSVTPLLNYTFVQYDTTTSPMDTVMCLWIWLV